MPSLSFLVSDRAFRNRATQRPSRSGYVRRAPWTERTDHAGLRLRL